MTDEKRLALLERFLRAQIHFNAAIVIELREQCYPNPIAQRVLDAEYELGVFVAEIDADKAESQR